MIYRKEKILVAEKVLGWKYSENELDKKIRYLYKRGRKTYFDDWDPKNDRNCWPEIWGKMKGEQIWMSYLKNIKQLNSTDHLSRKYYGDDINISLLLQLHTIPSKICWKALIKTLKGKKPEIINLSRYELINQ